MTSAPETQAFFSAQPVEKRKSLDELKDILNRQIKKAQNGKLNDTDRVTMKAEFQKIEFLTNVMRSVMAQQEQKEDAVNSANISDVELSEAITFENRISM